MSCRLIFVFFLVVPTSLGGKYSSKYKSISHFTNIKQIRLDQPGFFPLRRQLQDWKSMQEEVEAIIRRALLQIGYCHAEQQIEFHLSFLISTADSPQDPHIDYKWRDVLPRIGCTYSDEEYCYSVPFIGLFPLEEKGMLVDIWGHRDHREALQMSDADTLLAHKCKIPFGFALLMRGDTVHAGGHRSLVESFDARCHMYIHKTRANGSQSSRLRGVGFDYQSSTIYRTTDESSQQLSDYYQR